MTKRLVLLLLFLIPLQSMATAATYEGVRIKELCRLAGAKDNALVGYGIVTGLAGTGDSSRSAQTFRSIKNLLLRFGVNVPTDQVRTRNAAAVMVTTTLPAYAQLGDKLDINVSSLGDARSLVGGTLLLAHLEGPDQQIYALGQGPLSVGGFKYDLNGNIIQKNHPTSAIIPNGATVERSIQTKMLDDEGFVHYVLYDPDIATASRVADTLDRKLGDGRARAVDAARVRIRVSDDERSNLVRFLTKVEDTLVIPDGRARVVVNERTGTVVSGGGVRIAPITISHGDLHVAISTEFFVSQPSLVAETGSGVRTQVVPQTDVEVVEELSMNVVLPKESSVAELVMALSKVRASSRDIITILQGIKRAGALHAELIVQ